MGEIRSERQERRAQRREQAQDRRADRAQQPRVDPGSESNQRGPVAFLRGSYGELKKVEWPGQNQVIQGTVVVLIACIVVGAYLYVNDQVWKEVVQRVLLGQ